MSVGSHHPASAACRVLETHQRHRPLPLAVSSCVTDAFDTPFENLVEGLVSGLVLLFVQERLREDDERAGVAFSVGQVGRAVGVAVEDEEVFAVDNPTKTEFAEPAQLLAGYCSYHRRLEDHAASASAVSAHAHGEFWFLPGEFLRSPYRDSTRGRR